MTKGSKASEETKRKLRESHLGQVAWNRGLKGFVNGGSFKKGHKQLNTGKTHFKKGQILSEETKRKISETNKGHIGYMLGKKHSDEAKRKISEKLKGDKTHLWKGGISKELYGFDWTKLLKHSIRTRDCFICQICGKNGFVVHHIDYNKKNCNPDNLITLCRSCHTKTNHNREHWIKFFNK